MAKARTCSTSESIFVFVEKLVAAGAECGTGGFFGGFFEGESLGCGDAGPERDLRAFTADASASTVKFSDDIVAPDGLLLCDRRRRADGLVEVVEAECGDVTGDAGSIVNEGGLSAACCEEEFLLAIVIWEVTTEGVDLAGTGLAVGVLVFFSFGGEP
jgi:hypothetical protein